MIEKQRIFYGFSTFDTDISLVKKYDLDLVKTDLLNHFYTRRGERLMQPNYGSIIWDLLFEPLTDDLSQRIRSDVENIITQEPRVEAQEIVLIEQDHGFTVLIDLLFQPFNVIDSLEVIFDRRLLERGTND